MLTLELGTTSVELKKFTEYTPRIEISDRRAGFRHTINANSVITKAAGDTKHLWAFTAIADGYLGSQDFYLALNRLKTRQDNAIAAGTFTGITLTDRVDPFVEYAIAPTRQFVDAVTNFPDGAIAYYAKFLVGAVIDFDRSGALYTATITLTELGKLS